jgi:hypothetical protein
MIVADDVYVSIVAIQINIHDFRGDNRPVEVFFNILFTYNRIRYRDFLCYDSVKYFGNCLTVEAWQNQLFAKLTKRGS